MQPDPVRDRLLGLLRRKRTDLKKASLAVGRNPAYLHQFLHRGTPRVLPEETRGRLARLLGVDERLLRHDAPADRRGRRALEAPAPDPPPVPLLAAAPPGFARVVELDVRAAAGAGAVNDGAEETVAVWLFPEAVVRHEFRARPEDLRMIGIDGDSMAPLLCAGDRVVVDTGQRGASPPGIFVIWDGLGLVAKRLEHVPNSDPPTVVIASVNPDYQTHRHPAEEVTILGRVVWTGRRV